MNPTKETGGRDLEAETALFAHLVCRPEATLDLAQGALLLAAPEYPGLDLDHYLSMLDALAERARPRLRELPDARDGGARAQALVRYLLGKEGFRGNMDDFHDPRNSFLNEVLERRLGIPISLSVVMIEVGRRLEVPLSGVTFPGHFLLRAPLPTDGSHSAEDGEEGERDEGEEPALFLDPFTGRALAAADRLELARRMTGEPRQPTEAELQPASKHAILLRMLANLRHIYQQQQDTERLELVQERIRLLERAQRSAAAAAVRERLWH